MTGVQTCALPISIKEIGLIEIKEQAGLRLKMSYSQYQNFDNFLKAEDLIEFDTEFTDLVATTIYIDKQEKEPLEQKLVEFFNGKIQIDDQGLREVEIPLTVE